MSNPILRTPIQLPLTTIYSAVDQQLDYCREIPGYKCGIFYNSEYFKIKTWNYLEHNLIQKDEIKIIKNKHSIKIIFDNGSVIVFISARNNKRGYCLSGAIVDHMIDNNVFNQNIIPQLKCRIDKNDNPLTRIYIASTSIGDLVNPNNND